jgi:AraC family transcriptional regulator
LARDRGEKWLDDRLLWPAPWRDRTESNADRDIAAGEGRVRRVADIRPSGIPSDISASARSRIILAFAAAGAAVAVERGRFRRTAMPPAARGGRILISPDDRLDALPVPPTATSGPMGWPSLRVEHFRDTPDFELDLPGQTHHLLALYLRPPEEMGIRSEGLDWQGTPPPNSVLILPAGHPRQAFWRGPTESVHVHLDPRRIARVAAEACDLDPDRIEPPADGALIDPRIQAAILALDAELTTGGAGGRLLTESLANVLAIHLIRHVTGDARAVQHPRGGLPGPKLRAALEYIEEHLDTELALDDLASVAHLSSYHFARRFKTSTGLPPHQYVIARRVERAKQLLKGPDDLTLAQVAGRVGFWDQGHFTRHFKRLVGVTPKQFR